MIEDTDGPVDDATEAAIDAARIRVATEVRRLSQEFSRGDHAEADLLALADRLGIEAESLAQSPDRRKSVARFARPEGLMPPGDGEEFPNSADRPISGLGHPWSVPLHVFREGDRAVVDVTLGKVFEGAPGMSHGGYVAAIYDDLLGFLLIFRGTVAFTASLTVNYHSGTMIDEPLRFEAWIDRVEGKKLYLAGECRSNGEVISSCTGLFIDAADRFRALAEAASGTVDEQ